MSEPTWTERLFGGFRKTSERLSDNLAAAVTAADPEPDAAPAPPTDMAAAPSPGATATPAPVATPAPASLVAKVATTLSTAKLDDATLDHVEDALILSDLGPSAAARIRAKLSEKRFGLAITERELKEAVAEEIAAARKVSPAASRTP